jgi:hypothetical protein
VKLHPDGNLFLPVGFLMLGILAVGTVAYVQFTGLGTRVAQPGACTLEAKICPDGSTVSRSGPSCAFAACPGRNTNNASDPTKKGKTFSNEVFGYSLQLPTDWNAVSEFDGSPLGLTDNRSATAFSQTQRKASFTLQICPGIENCSSTIAEYKRGKTIVEESKITLGSVEFTRLHYDGSPSTRYLAENQGRLYEAIVEYTFRSAVETILATISFTDPTAGWKTYTNSIIGYSIQYPPSWKITSHESLAPLVQISPKSSAGVNTDVPTGDCCPGQTVSITTDVEVKTDSPSTKNRVQVQINDIDATQQEEGGMGNDLVTYFPRASGGFITISWEKDNGTATNEQILSTFRFTD